MIKLMVVDDQLELCDMLANILEDEGYEVCTANNGKEAINIIVTDQNRISVILLDLMMPEMDGFAFMHHLTRFNLYPVGVIMLTAMGHKESVERQFFGYKSDNILPIAYIAKPFELLEIYNAINLALEAIKKIV